MKQSIKYSLLVYLTGNFLAVLFFILIDAWLSHGWLYDDTAAGAALSFTGIFIALSLLCSLPSLLLFWLSVFLLNRTDITTAMKKVLLILLTFCLITVSFHFFPNGGIPISDRWGAELYSAFFLAISLSTLIYRPQKKHPTPPTHPDDPADTVS
jgi:hypothetical protein